MPKFRARLTKAEWEALPEEQRAKWEEVGIYTQVGETWMLDAEGVEDVNQLRNAFEKTKKELKDNETKLLKFKDVDPERYKELLEEKEQLETRAKDQRGEWDALARDMQKKHEEQIKEINMQLKAKDDKLAEIGGRYQRELIKREAVGAIAAAKGIPALLLPHVEAHTKVVEEDDGRLTIKVIDPNTKEVRGDANGKPLTIEALLQEWKGSDVFGRGFEGSGSNGSGSPTNRGSRNSGQAGIHLSREDAQDVHKFRKARAQAEKDGVPFTWDGPEEAAAQQAAAAANR